MIQESCNADFIAAITALRSASDKFCIVTASDGDVLPWALAVPLAVAKASASDTAETRFMRMENSGDVGVTYSWAREFRIAAACWMRVAKGRCVRA